tara:strand:+ start:4271 stop:4450 length:180 start_codon:yes stop_codon:yes gene_type:complete
MLRGLARLVPEAEGIKVPPSRPIALNLATIVHRLLTRPRGWEIEDLRAELEIADRTYRN